MTNICVECKAKYTTLDNMNDYICDICKFALDLISKMSEYKYCRYTDKMIKKRNNVKYIS